jgi:hypothetical protein
MSTGFRKNGIATCTRSAKAWRPVNQAERNNWYESDASKGMDCAGETKLPPQDTYFDVEEGTIVHIFRARVRARQGYRMMSNCMEVMLPTGEVVNVAKANFSPLI